MIEIHEPGWLYQISGFLNEEIKVLHEDGWLKYHLFTGSFGLWHGELRQYRKNGEIALREFYIEGTRKNCAITTKEDRMYVALKYGAPLIDET